MWVIEADSTLIIIADTTFVGGAPHLGHVLQVDTSRFEVFLGELLVLFNYFLQLQPCFTNFNQIARIQGINLSRR